MLYYIKDSPGKDLSFHFVVFLLVFGQFEFITQIEHSMSDKENGNRKGLVALSFMFHRFYNTRLFITFKPAVSLPVVNV